MPPGYFVDSTLAAGRLPSRWEELDGEFTVSIRRGYPDSAAARLLRVAEALCPPRDLLVRIAMERSYDFGDDSAGVPLWWHRGTGEGRVPYAVTAAAVEYYMGLTELYRERKFREAGTRPLFWSELIYRSTIAERDTFALAGRAYAGVYVANQSLFWSFDDGTFVPRVEARRVVVLTPGGEVLAVDGDGAARETATISTHRGVGRKEELLR
jgi:hypothetical protein